MGLVESNFKKHGQTSFGVWIPQGETVCVALRNGEKVDVGFVKPSLWKAVKNAHDIAGQLRQSPDFLRIYELRIIKSGWFMFATVDFTVAFGVVIRGKTDKSFAEFLVSISDQIESGKLF